MNPYTDDPAVVRAHALALNAETAHDLYDAVDLAEQSFWRAATLANDALRDATRASGDIYRATVRAIWESPSRPMPHAEGYEVAQRIHYAVCHLNFLTSPREFYRRGYRPNNFATKASLARVRKAASTLNTLIALAPSLR
jgi:hypothetical protein